MLEYIINTYSIEVYIAQHFAINSQGQGHILKSNLVSAVYLVGDFCIASSTPLTGLREGYHLSGQAYVWRCSVLQTKFLAVVLVEACRHDTFSF